MWLHAPNDITPWEGFVYCITDTITGKYYIGKKSFWKRRTLKPLKGKKRKRHTVIESDWKDYWGSSKDLLKDINKYGKKRFERVMISCFETKFEVSYWEAKLQFDRDVLFDKKSYNGIINCRLRGRK